MGLFDLVEDFIDDPISTVIDTATQPLHDAIEILGGISEGELRSKATLRLGVDIVAGMSLGQLIEFIAND
jgi:hypothetical protein